MNEIIFMLGDWPVRTVDALIGFGALVLILMVVIAVVIARSGRRVRQLLTMRVGGPLTTSL